MLSISYFNMQLLICALCKIETCSVKCAVAALSIARFCAIVNPALNMPCMILSIGTLESMSTSFPGFMSGTLLKSFLDGIS